MRAFPLERFALENIRGPGPCVPARSFPTSIGAAANELRLLRCRAGNIFKLKML